MRPRRAAIPKWKFLTNGGTEESLFAAAVLLGASLYTYVEENWEVTMPVSGLRMATATRNEFVGPS